jgi:hypothetical protein
MLETPSRSRPTPRWQSTQTGFIEISIEAGILRIPACGLQSLSTAEQYVAAQCHTWTYCTDEPHDIARTMSYAHYFYIKRSALYVQCDITHTTAYSQSAFELARFKSTRARPMSSIHQPLGTITNTHTHVTHQVQRLHARHPLQRLGQVHGSLRPEFVSPLQYGGSTNHPSAHLYPNHSPAPALILQPPFAAASNQWPGRLMVSGREVSGRDGLSHLVRMDPYARLAACWTGPRRAESAGLAGAAGRARRAQRGGGPGTGRGPGWQGPGPGPAEDAS